MPSPNIILDGYLELHLYLLSTHERRIVESSERPPCMHPDSMGNGSTIQQTNILLSRHRARSHVLLSHPTVVSPRNVVRPRPVRFVASIRQTARHRVIDAPSHVDYDRCGGWRHRSRSLQPRSYRELLYVKI